jgi:hypothetical protein
MNEEDKQNREDVGADFGIFDACHVTYHFRKLFYSTTILFQKISLNSIPMPRSVLPRHIPCLEPGCGRFFTNRGGLTNHQRVHDATAQLRQRHRQPAVDPAVNINSENGPTSSDLDNNDLRLPSPPDSPRQQPREFSSGEEVRIHPLINGMSLYSCKCTYTAILYRSAV